jgi:hypothetical protein
MKMTFPTRTDLEFFQSRQRPPSWTSRIPVKTGDRAFQNDRLRTIIDDVVNAHAGVRPTSGEVAVHNLIVLVRSYQRRGVNLVEELEKLAVQPSCAINPEKRAAFARKWARRMEAT